MLWGFAVAKALRMNLAKSKAISIEVGMQNSGLASSLALMHFGAAAAIPGAVFRRMAQYLWFARS